LSSSRRLQMMPPSRRISSMRTQAGTARLRAVRLPLLRRHRPDQRLEDLEALRTAQFGLAGAFRVGHHAHDIAARTADAGNVVERAVRIRFSRDVPGRGRIAEHNAVVAAKFRERSFVTKIVAFHVADRNAENFALLAGMSER